MEWIWVIFIVFSIISGLAEKQKKGKQPNFPRKQAVPPGSERPLSNWPKELSDLFELEEEKEVETGKYADGPEKKKYPAQLSRDDRKLIKGNLTEGDPSEIMAAPTYRSLEGTAVLGEERFKSSSEMVVERKRETLRGKISIEDELLEADQNALMREEDDIQDQDLEENEDQSLILSDWDERLRLKEAVIFAHVMPRPDFRIIPWKRKV